MNDGLEQHGNGAQSGSDKLLPWAECELFCIKDYANTGPSPCGWRGRVQDATRDAKMKLICPRCDRDTLFRIPPRHHAAKKA